MTDTYEIYEELSNNECPFNINDTTRCITSKVQIEINFKKIENDKVIDKIYFSLAIILDNLCNKALVDDIHKLNKGEIDQIDILKNWKKHFNYKKYQVNYKKDKKEYIKNNKPLKLFNILSIIANIHNYNIILLENNDIFSNSTIDKTKKYCIAIKKDNYISLIGIQNDKHILFTFNYDSPYITDIINKIKDNFKNIEYKIGQNIKINQDDHNQNSEEISLILDFYDNTEYFFLFRNDNLYYKNKFIGKIILNDNDNSTIYLFNDWKKTLTE